MTNQNVLGLYWYFSDDFAVDQMLHPLLSLPCQYKYKYKYKYKYEYKYKYKNKYKYKYKYKNIFQQ